MQQIRLLHRSIHSRIEEVFCYRILEIELWIFEYPKSEARHSEYEVSNWPFSYIDGLSTAEDIKMCAPNVWLKHQLTAPNITLQIDFNENQLTQFMQHFTGVQNIYNMKDNESIWYQWGVADKGWIFLNHFLSKLNIWNVNRARATAFIFDTRTGVLEKVSKFLRQKMSRPKRNSNPQPSDSCRML